MNIDEQILYHFQRFLEENKSIEIMNYYHGLPVSSKGRFEQIDSDSAVILVEPPASVCLCWEEIGWLLMDESLGPVKAEVESFDILSGKAVFGNFELMGPAFGRRAFLRVEAEDDSPVDLERPEGNVQAWLKDVSLVGASLSVPQEEMSVELKKFDRVRFTLHLPRGTIRLSGQVKNVARLGQEQRIGLMYTDSIPLRGLIPDYISFRRAEILKELADRYQMAYDVAKEKKAGG